MNTFFKKKKGGACYNLYKWGKSIPNRFLVVRREVLEDYEYYKIIPGKSVMTKHRLVEVDTYEIENG